MSGEPQEKELYSFGPMGVRICFSRPGFFTPVARNITRIVLTDKRIIGEPKRVGTLPFFKDRAGFQVPLQHYSFNRTIRILIQQRSLHTVSRRRKDQGNLYNQQRPEHFTSLRTHTKSSSETLTVCKSVQDQKKSA